VKRPKLVATDLDGTVIRRDGTISEPVNSQMTHGLAWPLRAGDCSDAHTLKDLETAVPVAPPTHGHLAVLSSYRK
jgi:hypothetical protein